MNSNTVAPEGLARAEKTLRGARQELLAERTARGHWEGYLSSSALSTATASAALFLNARSSPCRDSDLALAGCAWLGEHQNADGGWGDTQESPSNVSTTLLVWMALGLAPPGTEVSSVSRAEAWLREDMGSLEPVAIAARLKAVYGKDHTFAVPILVACAIGGRLGTGRAAWGAIPALPFELAALPQKLFRWAGLPVVSYAMPALIAIGQAIHDKAPRRNPFTRLSRNITRARTLRVLHSIQPENGGFLEATPLTSFVALSLMSAGQREHPVNLRAMDFLRASARPDGSWPIDTNLATWTSTLSIQALATDARLAQHLDPEARRGLTRWLLNQQLKRIHPYTGAAAGGWAWTDLPGGVPDADDTAGALLALFALQEASGSSSTASQPRRATPEFVQAAHMGCCWLLDLANRDGGMPTFCRGFGKLPFDQSCPDLTAHALRAWAAWKPQLGAAMGQRIQRAEARALKNLMRTQRTDGAWVPLWFGNQAEARRENPLYGTTRVLRALSASDRSEWRVAQGSALEWLLAAQDASGGFGAAQGVPPSLEETGMALEALAAAAAGKLGDGARVRESMWQAALWLAQRTQTGQAFQPSPIGLYFAQLWYSERLYPLVHVVSGLGAALPWIAGQRDLG